eukprot:188937-Chlamydomonas_euryale.AAC.4
MPWSPLPVPTACWTAPAGTWERCGVSTAARQAVESFSSAHSVLAVASDAMQAVMADDVSVLMRSGVPSA